MLVAVVLALEPVGSCVLPASHGALAYAGALDLLRRVSPALASSCTTVRGSRRSR